MGKVLVGVLAFAGGVATGLLIAKLYVRSQVKTGAHDVLNQFGLGGGAVEGFVDTVVLPQVTG